MKKILLLILLLVIQIGCEKTSLYYVYPPGGELHVATDWTHTKSLPNEMVAYFYSVDENGQQIEDDHYFDYMSNAGGIVFLPYGSYRSFTYNNNIKDIKFRNMSRYTTAEAYLEPDSKTPPFATRSLVTNTNYIGQIGELFTSPIEDFSFNANQEEYYTDVFPKLQTQTLKLKIKVGNLVVASLVNGTLSGVAQTINLSTGETSLEAVANVIFDFNIEITAGDTDGYITADVNYFALLVDKNGSNVLELAFKLKDAAGTELIPGYESTLPPELIFDYSSLVADIKQSITEDVRENGGEVVLDGGADGEAYIEIKLPDVVIDENTGGGGGGGFDAEVGDWIDGEIIDLPI